MDEDFSEIIGAVEDRFGISISAEEAQGISTAREISELVIRKLDGKVRRTTQTDDSSCATQRAFYLLRRKAAEQFGVRCREFQLDTPLNSIVPRVGREEAWLQYAASVGARSWPELHYSRLIGRLLVSTAVLTYLLAVFCLVHLSLPFALLSSLILGVVPSALLIRFLHPILREHRVCFRNPTDVRGLVEELVAGNPTLIRADYSRPTRGEIRDAVRRIICQHFDLPSSAFNDDLKLERGDVYLPL